MATINVQAGVAAHVLAERPDAAAEALAAIKLASKEGLRELRAILNVLRQADETDPTQPAPGLAPARRPDRQHRPGWPGHHAHRSPATGGRCRPRSTWPPTGSSRSR